MEPRSGEPYSGIVDLSSIPYEAEGKAVPPAFFKRA